MGVPLFDFAANVGKKIFNRGEDSITIAQKLQKHIDANNPGISDLDVVFDGDTATISGTAKDAAAYEKAVLMAGNVEGVAKVEAAGLGAPGDSTFVLVKAGDTLWGIAERELEDGSRYNEIFAANREVIENPDLIYPGQKIRIPKG
jgi:nucleoid-associated protein YgaU